MLRNRRSAILTNSGVNPASADINIVIESYTKLMVVNDAYLTPRIIMSNPNIEITAPTTQTLTDPIIANRFILVSRNNAPNSDMEYSIYYDTKYSDMFVIPSLEVYNNIDYIGSLAIEVGAYGLTFSGDDKTTVPALALGVLPVNSVMANIASYVNKQSKGMYYEHMITPTYNFSSTCMYPSLYIDFGLPSALFQALGDIVDINVVGYNSLFSTDIKYLGKQKLANIGRIVAELPL